MTFPTQYEYMGAPPLPSIAIPVSGADRFREHGVPFASSPAMAIPGIITRTDAPPPLPPPKLLPFGDAPTQLLDFKKERRHPQSLLSSSSLSNRYGSLSPAHPDDRYHFGRGDAGSLVSDEGYSSFASNERARDSLPTEFGLHHNKFQFSAADLHGDCMKKKLDSVRPLDKSPPLSLLTSSISGLANRAQPERRFHQSLNAPFQLPIHSRVPFEAQQRDFSPTFSSHSTPVHQTPARSPLDSSDHDHSPRGSSRRNNSDDASMYGSFAEDTEMDETSSLKRLHIEDAHATIGQKRRAASPAADDLAHYAMIGPDMLRRRDGANRGSPTPRLSSATQNAGLSAGLSASLSAGLSAGLARSGLYMPGISMPSSLTNNPVAAETRSPDATSPRRLSPTPSTSPFTPPASLNHSSQTVASRVPLHARNVSHASSRKPADMQKPSVGPRLQGYFMCECCPKKPKKFETREELSAHEAEKQYECSFCGNRFKNKNEAERHQNSLHVRRHSWSCSALAGYYRAFHESTVRPGQADACGYCGEEFPRSGVAPRSAAMSGGMSLRHATDQDWDERIRHLQEIHKFRECNSSKKFYRADHFRQHLKHSHAGTSGKWTNMLENACLIEEDPTPR